MSQDCEELDREVDHPAVDRNSNPKFVVGEYAVALSNANDNMAASRSCQQNQRERLAKGMK